MLKVGDQKENKVRYFFFVMKAIWLSYGFIGSLFLNFMNLKVNAWSLGSIPLSRQPYLCTSICRLKSVIIDIFAKYKISDISDDNTKCVWYGEIFQKSSEITDIVCWPPIYLGYVFICVWKAPVKFLVPQTNHKVLPYITFINLIGYNSKHDRIDSQITSQINLWIIYAEL